MVTPVRRRDFLEFLRLAGMAAVIPNGWRVRRGHAFQADPFALGIGSGDPSPTGVTLWTRLAPRPLEPDGGMGGVRVVVRWEIAEDEAFSRVVQRGQATAAPELGHSVHAEVEGLAPGRWYFYRFNTAAGASPIGRTRTASAPGDLTPFRFGVASCQFYEEGYYTAYQHMAREGLDLVTHLGDYIYEYSPVANRVRRHATPEIQGLDDYRIRYAQYKTDPDLRAAHAACPWMVTWDDHEVDNNYAGLIGENRMESEEQMRARRAAGYQAWWENQPVRVPRARSWADLTIRRGFAWGGLARLWVLDTRQYRSDQACGDGNPAVPCGEWADPDRTLLGAEQEAWLTRGLREDRARWQVLAQQIMLAPFDGTPGPVSTAPMDMWNGYPVARDRLLQTVGRAAPNRTVVLTGDIHSSWVNELRAGFDRPDRPVVAAEFVGTSISSGGDGMDRSPRFTAEVQAENPWIKWQHSRRGYFSCRVEPETWQTDYRIVPYITRPGAPVETVTRWRLERGRPGIQSL
jgi:alkaline phosphatase D